MTVPGLLLNLESKYIVGRKKKKKKSARSELKVLKRLMLMKS